MKAQQPLEKEGRPGSAFTSKTTSTSPTPSTQKRQIVIGKKSIRQPAT